MRKFLYARMALTNIKKHSKIYFPYILTCIGSIAMFFIMYSLAHDEGLNKLYGGAQLGLILSMGVVILGIFSAIFLFYTHSFLIKRRKREFGIYNILGMEKKHISRMMCWEMIFTAAAGLILGIASGLILSKLCYMLLLNLMNSGILSSGTSPAVSLTFSLSSDALKVTILLFAAIFIVSLLNTLRQIHVSNPVELLSASNQGEKEPKIKWPLVLIGLITLITGYYLAVTVKDIMAALGTLLIAILLVIIGTYCLFTAGSIAVLKLMRRNKSYYYKARHFTSISGLLYRMKQNAVGLANICILSTAVLVTMSTTVSLYIGLPGLIRTRYPRNIIMHLSGVAAEDIESIDSTIAGILSQYSQTENNTIRMRQCSMPVLQNGTQLSKVLDTSTMSDGKACTLYLITLDDYKKQSNDDSFSLNDDEIFVQKIYGDDLSNTVTLGDKTWHIKGNIDNIAAAASQRAMMVNAYYLVMPSENAITETFNAIAPDYLIKDYDGKPMTYYYAFDLLCDKDIQTQIAQSLEQALIIGDANYSGYLECEAANLNDINALYGSFFFIGIFIGFLFIMATVLIIYYKQISEGYEDRARYAIMQKVGMSLKEVRRSIKSQVLTVFFLPLCVACIHLAFAFPLMKIVLSMMNLSDFTLYAFGCIGTVIVFALFYTIVYGLTARTYYKIVSGK